MPYSLLHSQLYLQHVLNKTFFLYKLSTTQLTFRSKSTIETIEKVVKYVQRFLFLI